jgi:hypothetical protein
MLLSFPAAEHQLPSPDGSSCPGNSAAQLRSLFECCCHRDPQQRPSAQEVAQHLQLICQLFKQEVEASSHMKQGQRQPACAQAAAAAGKAAGAANVQLCSRLAAS